MHIQVFVATLVFSLFACSEANAQRLFKCGATFQDKPCDTEIQQKYSALTGSFTKEQVTANADTQCASLGARALPIIQSKLKNDPVQNLHAQVDQKPLTRQERSQEKDLITAVYSKTGTAIEIRGGIENDCMDKKRGSKMAVGSSYPAIQNGSYANKRAAAEAAKSAADGAVRR